MTDASPPFIIAVVGPVGAGKSTLAHALGARLGATVLHFDDYERITQHSPDAIRHWLEQGADIDALVVDDLPDTLARLKRGLGAQAPDGRPLAPSRYVVLETQFGRHHRATGQHVDFMLWLDTPPDVALARKLRQLVATLEKGEAEGFAVWLGGYLDNYLGMVHALLRMQRERIAPDADLVLDGLATTERLVEESALAIRRRSETGP